MIKYSLNENQNLEILLEVPPFIFKKWLIKNQELNFNELWKKLVIFSKELEFVLPERIGALTDAPIIKYRGAIYWLNEYEIIDEFSSLLNGEIVTFIKAKIMDIDE